MAVKFQRSGMGGIDDYIPSQAGVVRYAVQGKRASLNEYVTHLALDKLGIAHQFQYKIWGGIGTRGGVSVDFLTTVYGIPIEVLGERWHTGALGADDQIRAHRIEGALGRKIIWLWGRETEEVDVAAGRIKELYRAPI